MPMRDLAEVISQMLAYIPVGEKNLRTKLEGLKQRSLFTAPEISSSVQLSCWQEVQQLLIEGIPGENIQPGSWQEKVISIWVGDRGGGVLFNPGAGG